MARSDFNENFYSMDYAFRFVSQDAAMEAGKAIHEILRGDDAYISNGIILNVQQNTVSVFAYGSNAERLSFHGFEGYLPVFTLK